MKNVYNIGKGNLFIFLLLPMFLFFISLTSAAVDTVEVDDVFKVNDIVTYSKGCLFNGTFCSAAATCNYTFYDLNKNILVNNVLATNVGVNSSSIWEHNITYTSVGVYQIDMVCSDQGFSEGETFYAQITGDGLNDTAWFYGIILLLSFGVLALGFYMEDSPIIIFGTFGLYFLGLYILFNGIAGVKDEVTTWALGIIMLGIAFYVSARATHELITNK